VDLFANFILPRRSFDLRVKLSLGAETVALVGPSGSGKSSLLRALAGLERPVAGHVTFGEEVWMDVSRGIHLRPERRRVGYLPQDYALFPHMTVAGNVRFAARQDRPELLTRVGVAHLASARPLELSGGERQRVALARALARDPHLLLLDEPFAALDAITRDQVRAELADLLPTLALPALLVTHAFEDATALADRIGVLDRGEIVQLGPPAELLHGPASALVAALTGANTLAGVAQSAPFGSIVRLEGGGELRSSTSASGPVQVAVQPWAIELTDPGDSPLTDTVVSVHPDRGSMLVRLTRLSARVPEDGSGRIIEGAQVGLRVSPEDVRLL
jgi:molybdate transport system ATP-binding protein